MEPDKVWRVGNKVKLNVYEGDRPVCQCHTEKDAARIVNAVNYFNRVRQQFIAEIEANKKAGKYDE